MDIQKEAQRLTNVAGPITELAAQLAAWVEDAAKDTTVPVTEVARALLSIKEAHKELDTAVKKIYHVKDALEKFAVPTRLEMMDLDSIRVPEVARSFSVQNKMSASFLDKEKGYEWLREIGQGDIIQETVNAGTLTSFVRNMILDEGIDPPDDIVKVSEYKTISIAKYTPKAGAK